MFKYNIKLYTKAYQSSEHGRRGNYTALICITSLVTTVTINQELKHLRYSTLYCSISLHYEDPKFTVDPSQNRSSG